jgi:hypothetical protein
LTIKRDATLTSGASDATPVEHKVDVYWEFEFAGIVYHTVIQAKGLHQPVALAMVDRFRRFLDKLPDNPRGIMLTSASYRPGVYEYALNHNIRVFHIKPASPDDQFPSLVSFLPRFWE